MSGEHEPTTNEEMPVHIDDEEEGKESPLDQLEQKILAFVVEENPYSTTLGDMIKHMVTSNNYPPVLFDVSQYRSEAQEGQPIEYIIEFTEQEDENWTITVAASTVRLSPISGHAYNPAVDLWLVSVNDDTHKIEYGWCLKGTSNKGSTMQSPRTFQFDEQSLTLPKETYRNLPQDSELLVVFMARNPEYLQYPPDGSPWEKPLTHRITAGTTHFTVDFDLDEAQQKYTSFKQFSRHYDAVEGLMDPKVVVRFERIKNEDEGPIDASSGQGGAE